MIIGTPAEIKDNEYRVGLIPNAVHQLTNMGHRVLIQKGAGLGSGIGDEEYGAAGAEIVETADDVFDRSDIIVKVKEPLPEEYGKLRKGQILYTFLHLAPVPDLTRALLEREIIGIAYETILENGALPCLIPMSEVAGRMSVQIGAHLLERMQGGRGILLGGVPGVPPSNVIVIGAGVVGLNAIKIAHGMGARTTVIDIDPRQLRKIDDLFHGQVVTLMSNPLNIEGALRRADLLIGGVLVTGAKAPHIVTRDMLAVMKKDSVIVDVSVDQGGCVETIHPTSHSEPTYFVDGVLHYGVANIPGAVPRTSTFALSNATMPYLYRIVEMGLKQAIEASDALRQGVNVYRGHLTYKAVADDQGLPYTPLEKVFG